MCTKEGEFFQITRVVKCSLHSEPRHIAPLPNTRKRRPHHLLILESDNPLWIDFYEIVGLGRSLKRIGSVLVRHGHNDRISLYFLVRKCHIFTNKRERHLDIFGLALGLNLKDKRTVATGRPHLFEVTGDIPILFADKFLTSRLCRAVKKVRYAEFNPHRRRTLCSPCIERKLIVGFAHSRWHFKLDILSKSPRPERLVESTSVFEHFAHISHVRDVPAAEVLIEKHRPAEQTIHVGNVTHVPVSE